MVRSLEAIPFVMFNSCPHSQLKSVTEKWKQASDKVDEEVGKLGQDAPDAVGKVTGTLGHCLQLTLNC